MKVEGNNKIAMLAQPTAKMNKINWGDKVFVQPKLDGVRCLFTKNGAFSRAGNQFKNVAHLEAQLFNFFKENPDVILDGELYNHDLKNDFEKIISLVKKTVNISFDDRTEAAKMVEFHVYDCIIPKFLEASYLFRLGFVELNLANLPKVKTVTTLKVEKERDIIAIKDQFLAAGYEGAMIRQNGAYEHKRSYNLIKVKDFIDFEAEVIGFVEGKGKLTGKLGKFVMKRLDTGLEFGAPASGHTHEQRQYLWENRNKFMGTEWTVCAFEFTKKGAPRFPVLKTQRNYE